MTRSTLVRGKPNIRPIRIWDRLKEISMFFQGRDEVHKTMRRLVNRLKRAGIPYVVVGGMAVNAHHHRRTTADVDILTTSEGLVTFREKFVPKNYRPFPNRSRRFVDKINEVTLDLLVTGQFPGMGKPGPIAFPDPKDVGKTIGGIHFLDLVNLIQLKLAARRYQDFADVVSLIRANNLDESFREKLHPSVRSDFIECLEEKKREDDYEARQD